MVENEDLLSATGKDVGHLVRATQLEAAVGRLRVGAGCFDAAEVEAQIRELNDYACRALSAGERAEAQTAARRAFALRALLAYGPNPDRMVAEVELPEGYQGKIVLVLFKGGGFEGTVVLRSGDGWHREILNNARSELRDLGFPSADAYPLGGAYAGFDSEGRILIWGTSDEFGACDKEPAAEMIRRAYPRRTVVIED